MVTTLLTCGNELVFVVMTLLTCGNDLVSCGNDLLTRGNDLLTCGNNLVFVVTSYKLVGTIPILWERLSILW